jgi:hypothetical protein
MHWPVFHITGSCALSRAHDYLDAIGDFVLRCRRQELTILGYSLLPQEAHWIIAAPRTFALPPWMTARALRSSQVVPMMRYIENLPTSRAISQSAEKWRWSSAAAHCGVAPSPEWLASTEASRAEWRLTLEMDDQDYRALGDLIGPGRERRPPALAAAAGSSAMGGRGTAGSPLRNSA